MLGTILLAMFLFMFFVGKLFGAQLGLFLLAVIHAPLLVLLAPTDDDNNSNNHNNDNILRNNVHNNHNNLNRNHINHIRNHSNHNNHHNIIHNSNHIRNHFNHNHNHNNNLNINLNRNHNKHNHGHSNGNDNAAARAPVLLTTALATLAPPRRSRPPLGSTRGSSPWSPGTARPYLRWTRPAIETSRGTCTGSWPPMMLAAGRRPTAPWTAASFGATPPAAHHGGPRAPLRRLRALASRSGMTS